MSRDNVEVARAFTADDRGSRVDPVTPGPVDGRLDSG